MSKKKSGKASNSELAFIRETMNRLTDEEMASSLNRSVEFVKKQKINIATEPDIDANNEILVALHKSNMWKQVKKQLIDDEVECFEEHWVALFGQFSQHDIMASDEMSIKDLILHEISTDRAQIKKAETLRQIDTLERLISKEMEVDVDDGRDVGSLSQWESARSALIGSLSSLTEEIMEYQKKKDEKLKQLKATRETRLKNAEQSTSNFWAMCRHINTQEMRRHWSKYMTKMRMAGQIVEMQWSQPIAFEDGKVDKPFLSPEGELRDRQLQADDRAAKPA